MSVPLGTPSTYRPITSRQPSRRPRPLAPVSSEAGPSSATSAQSPADSLPAASAKKKRCRVTKEQLVRLETLFAANMSPTIDRRKEIAIALGMTERQTQIWFQNRRAKQRIAEGRLPRKKRKPRRTDADEMMTTITPPPPDSPPGISAGFDAELHALINENDAVTIIPCDSLTIGTWRRVSPPNAKHTLVAYACEAAQRISWFIQDAGKGFKISIPFDAIVNAEFEARSVPTQVSASSSQSGAQAQPIQPEVAVVTIHLSRPPLFSFQMDAVHPVSGSTAPIIRRSWHVCHDWTQGQQATHVLRHRLQGPVIPLRHFVDSLNRRLMKNDQDMIPTLPEQGQGDEGDMRGTPSPASSAHSTEYYTPTSTSNSDYVSRPVSPLDMTAGLPLPVGDAFEAFPFQHANSPTVPTSGQHMMYLDLGNASADSTPQASHAPNPQRQALPDYYGAPRNPPPYQAPEELPFASMSVSDGPPPLMDSSLPQHEEHGWHPDNRSSFAGGLPIPDPSESQEHQAQMPHQYYQQYSEQQQVYQQPQAYQQVQEATYHHQEPMADQSQHGMEQHNLPHAGYHVPQGQHFPTGLVVPTQDASYMHYSTSQQTTPTPIIPSFSPSSSSLAAMITIPRNTVPINTKYYTLEYPYETSGSTSTANNSSTVQQAPTQQAYQQEQQQQQYVPLDHNTFPDSSTLPPPGNISNAPYQQPTVPSTALSQPDVAAYFQQQVLQAQSNYNYSTGSGLNSESPPIISPAPRYIMNAQRLQENTDSFDAHRQQGGYQ